MAAAGGPSRSGSGGMRSKLQAAQVAMRSGAAMVIAHGGRPGLLRSILSGQEAGTLFLPEGGRLDMRKRWIAFYQQARGALQVDDGARRAIVELGKSLLPVGVVDAMGSFDAGDVVRVVDLEGREIARGLVNYSAEEVAKIMRATSDEIERRLGRKEFDELIHRDNLVLSTGEA